MLRWPEVSSNNVTTSKTFDRTAIAFQNTDFVDVVVHAYRFVFRTEEGDKAFEDLEKTLAFRPSITVSSITLDGTQDPLKPGGSSSHDAVFAGRHERRVFDVGHAFPMEAPGPFAEAILDVYRWQS